MENINNVLKSVIKPIDVAIKQAVAFDTASDKGILSVVKDNVQHIGNIHLQKYFLSTYEQALKDSGQNPSVVKVRKSEVGTAIHAVLDAEYGYNKEWGISRFISQYRRYKKGGKLAIANGSACYMESEKAAPTEETTEQEESAPVPTKPLENPAIAGINAMFDGIKGAGLRYDETAALLRLIAMRLTDGEGANNNDCAVLAGVLRNVGALVTLNDTAGLEALLAPKVVEKRAQVKRAA